MADTQLNAWMTYPDVREPPLDPVTKQITGRWQERILALWTVLNATPQQRFPRISLTNQGAAIASTTIPLQSIPAKLYRVNVFAQIVRVGSVSASLTVRIRATTRGNVVVTELGPDTGNSLTTSNIARAVVVRLDKDGPLQYNTAYTDGGGANNFLYNLEISVEELPS